MAQPVAPAEDSTVALPPQRAGVRVGDPGLGASRVRFAAIAPLTRPARSRIRLALAGATVVALTGVTWNQLVVWFHQVDELRRTN